VPEGWFSPKDLLWNDNLSQLTTTQFLEKFKLTI